MIIQGMIILSGESIQFYNIVCNIIMLLRMVHMQFQLLIDNNEKKFQLNEITKLASSRLWHKSMEDNKDLKSTTDNEGSGIKKFPSILT